jgi:tetratricopeptide (TPR) repeat protein
MRFRRRASSRAQLLPAVLLGTLSACAGPTAVKKGEGPAPAATSVVAASPPVARSPVQPGGPPIHSEEDAEHLRRELDALPDDDAERPGRRQSLLVHYIAAANAALERQLLEEAYQSFEIALGLFESSELQDPRQPPLCDGLLQVAQRLDRIYSRRGAHPQVVTAMMVQLTLRPADQEVRRRYGELRSWLNAQSDGVRNLMRGRSGNLSELLAAPPATLLSDLEQTYRVWPAAPVREELFGLYRAEAANSVSGGKKSPKDFLQSLSASLRRKGLTNGPAFKVARMFLRASRPVEAVTAVKSLSQVARLSAEDAKLLDLLEATVGRPPSSDDGERLLPAIKLAMSMAQNPEDAEVSLQICRDVAVRAPKLIAAHLCTGELALALERKGLALRAFERARTLAPGERGVWEMVGRLYIDRLSDLVVDERTAELEGSLARVEAFYKTMRQQFPERAQSTGIAVALAEVGRGYYNAGRITDAVRFLERSIAVEPNAVALEQLGVLQLRRGEAEQAAATLERARAVFAANPQAEPTARLLFSARMGRLIAEALEGQANSETQRQVVETRERSLKQLEQSLDSNRLSSGRAAEAEIERGKLLYHGGNREAALEAFRRATEIAPESDGGGSGQNKASGQVYVDILAFLVPRGETDESLSTFHRALGRVRLPESMKIYASLWVRDLLQRSGQPTDPLAEGVLSSVQNGRWPAELAQWASGRLSADELLARADTPGRQAEANFYLGMDRLRAGDAAQAQARWRKVLETQMLGYFEFEMAGLYLRKKGAPTSPTLPSQSAPAPSPSPPGRPTKKNAPPAGSI